MEVKNIARNRRKNRMLKKVDKYLAVIRKKEMRQINKLSTMNEFGAKDLTPLNFQRLEQKQTILYR